MKIRHLGVELFHSDMTKVIVAFSNFANAPKTQESSHQAVSRIHYKMTSRCSKQRKARIPNIWWPIQVSNATLPNVNLELFSYVTVWEVMNCGERFQWPFKEV